MKLHPNAERITTESALLASKIFSASDDHRSRLAFHVGLLIGEINQLCEVIQNHEEEIARLNIEITNLIHESR